MKSHGIDYSGGTANRNPDTGIHFGVIPANDLPYWYESAEADYGPPTCGECGNEAVDYDDEKHGEYANELQHGCCDYACETCERYFGSEDAYGDEPLGYNLADGSLVAEQHGGDCDVFCTSSPYYTHAQYCSPCAPGACYLLNPVGTDGPKAYCFGADWFDEDNPCPYPVYRVADGECVYRPAAE